MSSRILIVEDDPIVVLMIEEHLEILGHRAIGSADCVAIAMTHLAKHDIDAAIIDVILANGETSAPVAEMLIARGIPFLVSTGGFIRAPEPAFAGRPILMKPFTLDRLAQAITEIA